MTSSRNVDANIIVVVCDILIATAISVIHGFRKKGKPNCSKQNQIFKLFKKTND